MIVISRSLLKKKILDKHTTQEEEESAEFVVEEDQEGVHSLMIISVCTLEDLSDDADVASQSKAIVNTTTTTASNNNHSCILSLSTDRIVRIQRTSDWQEEVGYESSSCASGCIDYIGLQGSSYFICAGGQRSNLLQVINWKHIKLADQLDLSYAILKIVKMEKDNDYSGKGREQGEVHSSIDCSQQKNTKDNTIIIAATTQTIEIIQIVHNGKNTANARPTATLKHTQLMNRIHTIPFQYKLDNTFNIQAFNQLINSNISNNNNNHNTHDDKLSYAYGRITNIVCRSISDGIVVIIAISNGAILKLQHLGIFKPTQQQNDKYSNSANNWLCIQCEEALSNVNSPVKCIWLNSHVFVSVHEDGIIVQWGVDNCQPLRRIKVNNMCNRELLNKMISDCYLVDQLTQSIQLCSKIGVIAFADRIGFIDMNSLSELESIEYLSIHAQTITAMAYQEYDNSLIAAFVKDKNTKDLNNPNTTSLVILPLSSRLKLFFTAQKGTRNQSSNNTKNQQAVPKPDGYADICNQPNQSNLRYPTISNNQLQRGKYSNYDVNNPHERIQSLNSNSKGKIKKNMQDNQNKQITQQSYIPIAKISSYGEQGLNNNSNNDQILKNPQQLNIVNAVPPNVLSNSMPDIYQSRHEYRSQFHKEMLPNIIPVNIPQLINHRHTYSSSRGYKQIYQTKEENQDDSIIHRTRLISKNDPLRKQLFVEPNSASPPVMIDTAFKQNWLFSENNNNSKVQFNQNANGVGSVSNNSILFPSQIVNSSWRQYQQLSSQQTRISEQSQLEASKLLSEKQHRSNSSNAYYGLDNKESQNGKIDAKVKRSKKSKDGMVSAVTEFKLSSDREEGEDGGRKDSKEQGNKDAVRYELQPSMITSQQREEYISNSRNNNNQDSLAATLGSQVQQAEIKRKFNQSLDSDLLSQYKQQEHQQKHPVSSSFTAVAGKGGEQSRINQSRQLKSSEDYQRIKQIVKDKRDISNSNNTQQNQQQIDQQTTQAERIRSDKIALSNLQHPKQLSHHPSPQQQQFKKQYVNETINQDFSSEVPSESKERSFQALQQHGMNSSMKSRSQNSSYTKIRQNSSQLKNAKQQYDFDEVLRRIDIDSSDKRQLLGQSNSKNKIQKDREILENKKEKKTIENNIIRSSSKNKKSNRSISSSNSKRNILEQQQQQLSDDRRIVTKNQGIQEESEELKDKIRQNSMLVVLSKNTQALTKRVITLEDESMRFRAEIAEIKRVNQHFQKQLRTYSLCNMRSQHDRDLEESDGRNHHTSRVKQVDQKELKKYDGLDSSSKLKKRPQSSTGEYSNKKSFKYQTNKIDDSHSSVNVVQSISPEKSWKKRSNTKKVQSSFEDDLFEWNSLREKITEKLEGFKEKRRKEEEEKQKKQQRQSNASVGILQDRGIIEGGIYQQRVESAKKKGLAKTSSKSINNTQQHNASSIMTTSNAKGESANKNKKNSVNKETQQQDKELQQQLNYDEMNKRYYYTSPLKNGNKKQINSQLKQPSGELDQQLFSGGQKLLTTELSVRAYTEGTGEKSGNHKGNRSYSGNNKNRSSVSRSIKSAVVQEQQSSTKAQTSNFSVGIGYKQQQGQGQYQQNTTNPSAVGSTSITQSSLPMRFGGCLDEMKVLQEENRDLRRGQSAKGRHK